MLHRIVAAIIAVLFAACLLASTLLAIRTDDGILVLLSLVVWLFLGTLSVGCCKAASEDGA